jgi:CelD/BcsL family acetyltransferase involved in cellulose biosynthesis
MNKPGALRVEEVRDARQLKVHRKAWDRLIEESPEPDLSQTYEWMTSWLDSFWTHRPISFLFVWEGERLVALLPLLDDRRGEFWCRGTLVLRANPHSGHREILCSIALDKVLDASLAHLQRSRDRVRVGWKRMQQDSEVSQALEGALRRHTLMTIGVASCEVPVARFEGDVDSSIAARVPLFREMLLEKRRKMEAGGEVKWFVADREEQLDRAMRDALTIESQNWRAAANAPYDDSAGIAAFHDQFSRRSADREWLRIYVLHLEDRPVSYIYGVVFRNEYCILKESHDGRDASLTPGDVLLGIALEDIQDQGFDALDLQGGPARWKHQLTDSVRCQVDLCTASHGATRCEACRLYHNHVKPLGGAPVPTLVDRD